MTNSVYITTTSITGNTYGEWVDLDGIESWDDLVSAFYLAIWDHHKRNQVDLGITDCELLVTDYEGELAGVFTGSHGCFDLDGFVDARDAAEALCGDGEEAIAAYINWVGEWNPEHFEDAYQGKWDSEKEYAENLADDMGLLDGAPEVLARYFDWESWTRDLFLDGYVYSDGYVFLSC